MKIINLALRSGYSFRQTYGFVDQTVKDFSVEGVIGIADINGSYGHFSLSKSCKAHKVKPIYGVRLVVVADPSARDGKRAIAGPEFIFLAKTNSGLKEIYRLIEKAYDNFYYAPRIGLIDVWQLSSEVVVIAANAVDGSTDRIDFIAHTVATNRKTLEIDLPKVAIIDNFYPKLEDKIVYQLFAGSVKRGDSYISKFQSQTYSQHILSTAEWLREVGDSPESREAIANTHVIAEQCNAGLSRAKMLKYKGVHNLDNLCRIGAIRNKIDLKDPVYLERYEREMALIRAKDYEDYFLVVADMVSDAKKTSLVGPGRGSSAGSLVCYLSGITEVNPLEHDLLFERFLDENRVGAPDIDIDFADAAREKIVKKTIAKYGTRNARQIANINSFKPKSALGTFAIELGIPKYEIDAVKGAIIDRSGGDARAGMCLEDTLNSTEAGQEFLEKFPVMRVVERIEGHPSHVGKHAAGLVICNEPITNFVGVDSRTNVTMATKDECEALDLLKIDILGLRTLTILQAVAAHARFDFKDYYKLPLDDDNVFSLFNEQRFQGIFQFDAAITKSISRQIEITKFNDLVDITSIARPGPLHSGGADTYIKRHSGKEPVSYMSNHPEFIKQTKDTFGIIIYQEQLMTICRKVGMMDWDDVSNIRKAISKSRGDEFFAFFKDKFMHGAVEVNKINPLEAEEIWSSMMTFGSWAFSLNHAVPYSKISYWCAWAKVYYPTEFAIANLNHTKSEDSALKLLRDIVVHDNLDYVAIDPDLSTEYWKAHEGKLLGGLTNIHGIGIQKARNIIKCRKDPSKWTPGLIKTLLHPVTPFDILYPTNYYWGPVYDGWQQAGLPRKISKIIDVSEPGEYSVIGKVVRLDLRDLNSFNEIQKRGGKRLESDSMFLKIVLQDDTDEILTRINRFQFSELNGQHVSDTLVEDESWVLIHGVVKKTLRWINIDAIYDLKLEEVYTKEEMEERFYEGNPHKTARLK